MIFNSYQFLFVFLPAFLVLFFAARLLGRPGPALALAAAGGVVFYASGEGASLAYLLPSLAVSYAVGWLIARPGSPAVRRALLVGGLAACILPLVFCKYPALPADVLRMGSVADWAMPLAMSFVVFQQVIFLLEMTRANARCLPVLDYLAAMLFFPKLVAGPLVGVGELAAQMRASFCRGAAAKDVAVGITYFAIGLFKKVIIADPMRPGVDAVFAGVAAGHGVPLLDAWVGLVTFFVMLYFDFSGYSDMAIGLARVCGVVLPVNFNSPLKADSLIDFWARWHITLMKFLLGFIYNPLALWRTRAAMAAKRGKRRLFAETAVFPAFATMLVSGVWHGGGWNFIIFGLAHGAGLSINQGWRQFKMPRLNAAASWALTFLFVLVSLVLFRAPDPAAAWLFVKSLAGLSDIMLPEPLARILAGQLGLPVVAAPPGGTFLYFTGGRDVLTLLLIGLTAALTLPNSQQIMGEAKLPAWFERLQWLPETGWSVVTALLVVAAVTMMSKGYERFVYFGF